MQHHTVTSDNIDRVREDIPFFDLRAEIAPGCETWGIICDGGQRGQMAIWPSDARGGICLGGDTQWGSWDDNAQTLTLDADDLDGSPIVYNADGERV